MKWCFALLLFTQFAFASQNQFRMRLSSEKTAFQGTFEINLLEERCSLSLLKEPDQLLDCRFMGDNEAVFVSKYDLMNFINRVGKQSFSSMTQIYANDALVTSTYVEFNPVDMRIRLIEAKESLDVIFTSLPSHQE